MSQRETTLIVGRAEALQLLTIEDCIPVMRQLLQEISSGKVSMLQRASIRTPEGNTFALMPGMAAAQGVVGSKVIIFPGPAARETASGIVPLFNTETGALFAIVDGESITVTRTAAMTAAATDVLANPNADSLAILGSGRQGMAHLQAINNVRELKRVLLWDFHPEAAHAAQKQTAALCDAEILVCENARDAVVGADIVCTTSKAKEPILFGEWLCPGTHVNLIGACSGNIRECDAKTLQVARVFLDYTEASLRDAGDLVIPINAGEYGADAIIGELGEVLLGGKQGRSSEQDITVFESVGLAVQDVAAANLICQKAREQGLGIEVLI